MHVTDRISTKAAFHRFGLGALELTVVSDGHILFDPAQPLLAPEVGATDFKQVLRDNFLPEDYVDIAMNVLVIKAADRIILIDSGAGATMGERSGRLVANLQVAGFHPKDITDIVLTHAHSDHIGGLIKANKELTFPNANVYITKPEHDFWLGPQVDLSKSKLADKQWFINFSVDIIKNVEAALGDKLQLVEPDAALFDFLKLIPAPGHTPGHIALQISSQGETLFHLGDSTHTHVVLFEHPEWGFEADYNFDEGVATRTKLLGRLADSRMRAFSFHLPFPGLGHVRRKNISFEWVMEPFTSFSADDYQY